MSEFWEWDLTILVRNNLVIFFPKPGYVVSFADLGHGIDGTDFRLLKFMARKIGFSYSITKPDSYYAALNMVCFPILSV